MRLTKKTIVLAVALLAIITTGVFGTIAYLTDTDEVSNTFTIGKVKIDVDEAKVNENGELINKDGEVVEDVNDAARTEDNEEGGEGNTYPMIPGKEYTKDPTMTVLAGSEQSFYRMMVTFTDLKDLREVFGVAEGAADKDYLSAFVADLECDVYGENSEWDPGLYPDPIVDVEANTITYVFTHKEPFGDNSVDRKLAPLFTTLKIPEFFDNEEVEKLADMQINVVGHAIQATGFNDKIDEATGDVTKWAEEFAWEAFDEQLAAKNGTGNEGTTPEGGNTDDNV